MNVVIRTTAIVYFYLKKGRSEIKMNLIDSRNNLIHFR